MKTALLIIDIQNDYFPNGANELVGSLEAAGKAREVLVQCRAENKLVVHIQHLSTREEATFFIPDTFGAAIHERVTPLQQEKVITKHYPNSFRETELLAFLQEHAVEHLVIAGMMTHMCVDATVRAAKDFGFSVTLIADACATKDLEVNGDTAKAKEVQTSFLAALAYFYATVQTTEAYIKGTT